ncbi:MAG TPA: hypothetical protein VFE60_12670 [Roseiarcus sp.]|nr:hypothetical protein [Roseiarcus sp.]
MDAIEKGCRSWSRSDAWFPSKRACILERYVDHIAATFGAGTGQKRGNPGQQEIELALDKLSPPRRPSSVQPAL